MQRSRRLRTLRERQSPCRLLLLYCSLPSFSGSSTGSSSAQGSGSYRRGSGEISLWLASELVLTRSQATGCRQVRLLHILMGSDIPRRGQPSCRCDALDFEGSQRGGSTDFHRSQEDIKIYKGQL